MPQENVGVAKVSPFNYTLDILKKRAQQEIVALFLFLATDFFMIWYDFSLTVLKRVF